MALKKTKKQKNKDKEKNKIKTIKLITDKKWRECILWS